MVPRFQRTLPIMNSLNKRVTAVSLVIVLLAVFTISSAGSMVADIVSYRAKLQEHFWSSAEPISSVEEWDAAYSKLSSALVMSPGNTDYLLAMGRMASWRVFIPEESESDLSPVLTRGYRSFRKALDARPYWGVGWSEFALFKSQIGQIDEEFEFAIFSSIATGPFESRSLINSLNATFGAWDELSPRLKEEAVFLFDLALSLPYKKPIQIQDRALELIDFYDLAPQVCEYKNLSEAALAFCDQPPSEPAKA